MAAGTSSPVGRKCEPVTKKVNKTTVHLIQGDLTAMDVDAWVFYAKENLDIGSGYGTAISMRGGMAVKQELEKIGSVGMGQAVITTAGEMKARHIIHACGPKFQEADLEKKLRSCMAASLKLASEKGLKTLAFPPMGAGFYGVPLDLCAKVMLEEIAAAAKGETSLEEVTVCVVDFRDFTTFRKEMDRV